MFHFEMSNWLTQTRCTSTKEERQIEDIKISGADMGKIESENAKTWIMKRRGKKGTVRPEEGDLRGN